jgi:hypothetical protein
MFDFLARLGGSKNRPSEKANEARPKYYQPERYYMRGPGPAWHAAHPDASRRLAVQRDEERIPVSEDR